METPFTKPGRFWRGNLHTHSTLSDGLRPPEAVCRFYAAAGYDFLALTEHFLERYGWPIADTLPFRDAGFTTLLGAELHPIADRMELGEPWHLLAVGLPADFAPPPAAETGPELAARALAAGAFVAAAHPQWFAMTENDLLALGPVHALEIFNASADDDNDAGESAYLLDLMLARGRRLLACATDDAHFVLNTRDRLGGWVMVKAEANEPDLLLAALKRGDFYASTGPAIHDIAVEPGGCVRVSCSPANRVFLIGGPARYRSVGEQGITEAAFDLAGWRDPYLRVVVRDDAGRKAWSNPIWFGPACPARRDHPHRPRRRAKPRLAAARDPPTVVRRRLFSGPGAPYHTHPQSGATQHRQPPWAGKVRAMAHQPRAIDALLDELLAGRVSRRRTAQRAALLGLGLPALGGLLRQRAAGAQEALAPPDAPRRPALVATPAGLDVDPYRWLENPDDPATIAYLEAENAYTEAVMAPTAELQEALYRELTGRIQQTDASVPTPWNGYLYYSRSEEGKDYDLICRRRDEAGAEEEILLDLNALAGDYLAVGSWLPSPDNRLLAYNLDETGTELYTLYVLDMETGETVDEVPLVWDFQWANDNRTLFYGRQDPEAVWPYWHHRHELGADPANDPLLYEEENREFELATAITKDRAFVVLYTESVDTNEARYVPAAEPAAEPRLFAPRQPGVRRYLEHHGDEFLVRTDKGAPNFKLVAVPVADPSGPQREIVPHRDDAVLDAMEVFERHVALFGRDQGFSQAWIHDLATGETAPIPFDEAVYVVAPGENWEFATDKLRLVYSSPVTPDTDLEIDLATGERTALKQLEVLGGHDPSRYATERVFATAEDGTRIPISVVSVREAPAGTPAGPRPLRLDGYGAYGSVTEPWFSILRLTLINRGVTFAQAHVRGGGELGRRWWEEGRLLNKRNTFTDFIACAEHLVAEGYTAPDRLIARGGSAGGLLMGVVATQRPDLFAVVNADVPAVEVIGGLLRSTNGRYQWPELGNPRDPEAYAYMRSYSPYATVRAQAYPTMLVTAGLQDRRVVYWEPAKWVARLRDVETGDNPLLLRTDMGSGHFGATGFQDANRETAFLYAFFLTALGMGGAAFAPTATAPHAARHG